MTNERTLPDAPASTSPAPAAQALTPRAGLSRRALLETAALAGATLALGGGALLSARGSFAAEPVLARADFLRLSVFLTGGQPLNAELAGRYQAALEKRDAQFGSKAGALLGLIATTGAAHIDTLLERTELTDEHRNTLGGIVSAWYMGIVGQDADAELISYANALMYRPTADVLVIPTYGAGPDSWGPKPADAAAATPAKTQESAA